MATLSHSEADPKKDIPQGTTLEGPEYLRELDMDITGAIMHSVHGILGYYHVSPSSIEYELGIISSYPGGDILFGKYLAERMKDDGIRKN